MQIVEKAAAKINLSLDTPFSHPDGSQEWEMVMAAVDLADYVTITTIPKRTKIEVRTDTGFLPNDRRNLAFQAAHILQMRFNVMEGVKIEIEKHIPVAAGLGRFKRCRRCFTRLKSDLEARFVLSRIG